MRLGNRFVRDAMVLTLLLTSAFFCTVTVHSLRPTVGPQGGAQTKPAVSVGNGLYNITFDTTHGKIIVHLPDDMRAGDTISGTVVAEPRGGTEAERAGNLDALKGYAVEVGGQKVSTPQGSFTWVVPDTPVKLIRIIEVNSGKEVANAPVTTQAAGEVKKPKKGFITSQGGDAIAAQPESADDTFQLPTRGQQGRAIEIFGPFDGDTSNTTLRFDPATGVVRPLAESPRKIVFESPTNFTGTAEIVVKEGGVEKKGNYRNLGVSLSAPKTNLTRGERTTLTVEVKGLEGIKEDVPLQLDARGVIEMDGGNFQNLRIRPQEIQPGGRYTTTRAITGRQAGGFNVTATVIVRRFDMCLQDDANPRALMRWNSFTGNYAFINLAPDAQPGQPSGKLQPGGGASGGGASQTGGKLQPGGGGGGAAQTGGATQTGGAPPTDPSPPPGGFSLTGVGKPSMKGCIITLSHNAPDRRVFARLDTCTNTGSATIQTTAPKTTFDITDSDTTGNACLGFLKELGDAIFGEFMWGSVPTKDELLAELKELRERKRVDCAHAKRYQEDMKARIAAIKKALRGFHSQHVLDDPIDEKCP
jgi:hypothetical protein